MRFLEGSRLALAGLVCLVFSNQLNAQADPERIIDLDEIRDQRIRRIESLELDIGTGSFSSLWHIYLTGADLAKRKLQDRGLENSKVVVVDSGVDSKEAIAIEHTDQSPRTVSRAELALLFSTELGKQWQRSLRGEPNSLLPLISGTAVQLSSGATEIIDPREYDIIGPSKHGTHVAGTVGLGSAKYGVSEQVDIYALNAVSGANYRFHDDLLGNLRILYNLPFDDFIANFSLRIEARDDIANKLRALDQHKNANIVVAAGNDRMHLQNQLAVTQVSSVTTVSAFSPSGSIADFSNYGRAVDITAPGVTIISRGRQIEVNGEMLEINSGTSMASPMVAGAFASLRAILPEARSRDLRRILYKTAWDIGETGKDMFFGHGLLNVYKAVSVALKIAKNTDGSREAITREVYNIHTYSFDEEIRHARFKREKIPAFSTFYRRYTHEIALLGDNVEDLRELIPLYDKTSKALSRAVRFAIDNRPNAKFPDSESFEAAARNTAFIQSRLLKKSRERNRPQDWSIIRSLSNAQLLMAVYEYAPAETSPIFLSRLEQISPQDLPDLVAIAKTRQLEASSDALAINK